VTIRADPAAAVGWQLFKRALRIHQTAEDRALWPPMRRALASRPGDLALLEAMEAEHAGIDQLIATIDASVTNLDAVRLGDLVDAVVVGVCGHLDHEEQRALPLIQAAVTAGQGSGSGTPTPTWPARTRPGSCRGCSTAPTRTPSRRCWRGCPNQHDMRSTN